MGKFIGDGSGLTNLPSTVPSGGIIMWTGSTSSVPSGWALCNGQNGTPDLRNRFVVGAGDSYSVGATGGSKDAVVVSHTHGASSSSAGNHKHSGSTSAAGNHRHSITGHQWGDPRNALGRPGRAHGGTYTDYTNYDGEHSHSFSTNTTGNHSHSITVNSAGESGTNKNLPPYYALAYIMKL